MEGKTCTKCGEWKNYSEFYKDKRNRDGLTSTCKTCKIEQSKEDYYKNREKKNNQAKELYKKQTEKRKQYRRKYYAENREKQNETTKQYYYENKEYFQKYALKYREKNGEKLRAKDRAYRKTERGRQSSYLSNLKRLSHKHKVQFTELEREEIFVRYNWTCQVCGIKVHDDIKRPYAPDKGNIDHIIPISKGGNSEPYNLWLLCRTCNLSKSNKALEENFKI